MNISAAGVDKMETKPDWLYYDWGDTAPREYGDFCNTTKLPCCGCCPCCEHRITVTSFQAGGDSPDGEARSYMGVYIRQRRTDRTDEILAKTDTTNIGSDKRPAGIDRAD